MNINVNNSDMSWLFGSASSSSGGLTNNLVDYGLIKSGSYKKLMNSYFDKVKSDNSESSDKSTKSEKKNKIAKTAYEMAKEQVSDDDVKKAEEKLKAKKSDKSGSLYSNEGKYSNTDMKNIINELM